MHSLEEDERPAHFAHEDDQQRYMHWHSLGDGSKKITIFNTQSYSRLVLCVRPNASIAISFNPPQTATRTVPWVQLLVFLDERGLLQVKQPAWRDDLSEDDLLDDLDSIPL